MAFDAGAVVGRLEMNIDGWKKSVEVVKKDQESLAGLVMRHEKGIKDLGKAFTVAGAAIVASLGAMVKKTADYGDAADEMYQRTGASVEILTGLDGVLRKNGASAEDLATGMKFLSGKMVDANNGNAAAIKLFKDLGISATDANGNLRSTTDVLFDVATKFKGMENGAVKTTAAVDLLGKGGMSLIPTLNLGAEGLRKATERAERFGTVLTQKAAQACSDFNDALVDLGSATQGLGIQISQALMPHIQDLIEGATNAIVKIKDWAKENPGLAESLSKVALGIGGLLTVLGPVLYMLPKFVKSIQMIKALGAKPIIITVVLAGAALVIAEGQRIADKFDQLRKEGQSPWQAFTTAISPFREAELKLIAARDATINLKGAMVLLGDAFKAIKGAIEAGAITPLANLMGIFKDFGLKTRTELTAELTAAEAALTLLKGSIESTPGQVEVLEGKISALKEAINGSGEAAKKAAEEKKKFAESIQSIIDKANPEVAALRQVRADQEELNKATRAGVGDKTALAIAMDRLVQQEVKLLTTTPQIKGALEALAATNAKDVVPGIIDMSDHFGGVPKVAKDAADAMSDMSRIAADAMRNIAASVVDAFNFKKFFGAVSIDVKFDSSAFDAMVTAATMAHEEVRNQIQLTLDANLAAASEAYRTQELQLSRAQEDSDRRRSRQEDRQDAVYEARYERDKRAIENSSMAEREKDAALSALEKKFEADKLARDIAREDAKVARDRAREDARYARQEAEEIKMAKIRDAGLQKLLDIQNAHQKDLDDIRAKEDLARQAQADKEEARQNSLWFKVKGIFATAVEQMATIWLTKFITQALTSLGVFTTAVASTGTSITQSLGSSISTMAEGLTSVITAIASALPILAKAIVSAATIIASGAKYILIAAAIALVIYAAFKAVGALFKSASGGAADGMGRVVERQDVQTSFLTRIFETLNGGGNIKTSIWAIAGKSDTLISRLGTAVEYLKRISVGISDLVKKIQPAASGWEGTVSHPTLFLAHPQERVSITPSGAGGRGGGGASQTVVNNFYINALDGADVERVVRDKIAPQLQALARRRLFMMPAGAIGGAG